MRNIIITAGALNVASHPDFPLHRLLDEDFHSRFDYAYLTAGPRSTLISTAEYSEDERVLVIAGGSQKFFDLIPPADRGTVFDRCLRIALRSLDNRIALNPAWMPYHENNRVSMFAFGWSSLRIIAEVNFEQSGDTYIFDLVENRDSRDLKSLPLDRTAYAEALDDLPALLDQRDLGNDGDISRVELEHLEADRISKGLNYDKWFSRLTVSQRDFVERPLAGPLRLRGAAGTGKTLAMVMKALHIAKQKRDTPWRILFLTHSWAMAAKVDDLIRQIGRDIPGSAGIEVFPLLALSSQRDYQSIGRQPLGLDSDEGKRKTLEIIYGLLDNFTAADWIAFKGGTSATFAAAIEARDGTRERKHFAWDILVEFGCVLAAQGLLGRAADKERYMRMRRVGYMMPLANLVEKEVVFRLWSDFLAYLKEHRYIAADQIVSDYLNELQTFFWEAARAERGWDVVLVDEMHLFNAQERLIFHNLLANADQTPMVVMALDPKQSPREVFTAVSDVKDEKTPGIYERARLPNPDKIDLVEVYRYTPEIAALIKGVIDTVPALDMNDDWNLPSGASQVASGAKPLFHIEPNATRVFRKSISLAKALQVEARTRGGQVAILCLDYEKFNTYYLAAEAQHGREVFVIRSRDDIEKLRYMNRRIVVSMPEYVAGLQFDTVVLVDANSNLVPESGFRGHSERGFLSELYLGMSRAEHRLEVVASADCDGLSPYIQSLADKELIQQA